MSMWIYAQKPRTHASGVKTYTNARKNTRKKYTNMQAHTHTHTYTYTHIIRFCSLHRHTDDTQHLGQVGGGPRRRLHGHLGGARQGSEGDDHV